MAISCRSASTTHALRARRAGLLAAVAALACYLSHPRGSFGFGFCSDVATSNYFQSCCRIGEAADPGPAVDFVVAPEPEHEQQLEPGPEQEPEQEIVEEATENLEATNEPAPQRDGTEVDANEVADDPFVHAMGLDGKDVPPGPEEKMSGWESEQKPATA